MPVRAPTGGRKDFASSRGLGFGMNPRSRALVVPVVCFAVVLVIAVASIFYIMTLPGPPTLPVLAGTVIHFQPIGPVAHGYSVEFSLAQPGRMVGSWYADQGGILVVDWVNDTQKFTVASCGGPWNESMDHTFPPGDYRMVFWSSGNLTVTQTIQVVYPGGPAGSSRYVDASPC